MRLFLFILSFRDWNIFRQLSTQLKTVTGKAKNIIDLSNKGMALIMKVPAECSRHMPEISMTPWHYYMEI